MRGLKLKPLYLQKSEIYVYPPHQDSKSELERVRKLMRGKKFKKTKT